MGDFFGPFGVHRGWGPAGTREEEEEEEEWRERRHLATFVVEGREEEKREEKRREKGADSPLCFAKEIEKKVSLDCRAEAGDLVGDPGGDLGGGDGFPAV